jgi:hypothetical protein
MNSLLKSAGGISTIWSLAAFAIAALLGFALKMKGKDGKVPSLAWAVVAAVALLGLVPIAGSLYVEAHKIDVSAQANRYQNEAAALYRIRATVLNLDGVPVESAKVWSSIGGEAKKVAGGWQFDVPKASVPASGTLTLYATIADAFLAGQSTILLAADHGPTTTIHLGRDTSASVRGIVTDSAGRAVEHVRVSVVGYGAEAASTNADGGFVLAAHAADGQQVELHAEKQGYKAVNQLHPAGNSPATIRLEHR